MTKDKAKFILIGAILLLVFMWFKKDQPSRFFDSRPTAKSFDFNASETDVKGRPIVVSADEKINIDVFEKVHPAVVNIATTTLGMNFWMEIIPRQGQGSGFVIDNHGYIMTNNHVVEGASVITVTMDDGTTYDVDNDSVSTDSLSDLAVLKINAQNLPALMIGDPSKMRVGDWVVAIGNALGQGIRATNGIVSRQKASIPVSPGQTLYDLIETNAAINPGNSGGPLVNMAGEVIGITSAKIATVGVEGMGYAISAETARRFVNCRLHCRPSGALCRSFKQNLRCDNHRTKRVAGQPLVNVDISMHAADEPFCYTPLIKSSVFQYSAMVRAWAGGPGGTKNASANISGTVDQQMYGFGSCYTFKRLVGKMAAIEVAGKIRELLAKN